MFLHLKNSRIFLILFYCAISISQELYTKDSIGKVIMLIDSDGTEQNDSNAPIADLLGQAIYRKNAPIITSGYTIERYLQNAIMTKAEYIKLKNETFHYIDDTSTILETQKKAFEKAKQQYQHQLQIKILYHDDNGMRPITGAEYIKILHDSLTKTEQYLTNAKDSLQPKKWVFREKEMQLTKDQWLVYKKNGSNFFLLIPKKYLAEKQAPADVGGVKKIGFNVSTSQCTDITAIVDKFCTNLPENNADFIAKYPAELKPPVKKSSKPDISNITSLFVALPPIEEAGKKGLVRLLPEDPTILWIMYLQGHGSFAGPATESEAEYNNITDSYAQAIKFYENALKTVRITGKPCSYTLTETTPDGKKVTKEVVEDETMLQEELTKARQRKLDYDYMYRHIPAEYTYIAGLTFKEFEKLITFFNTSLRVAFLYYSSCFAGGYNQAIVNQVLNNIVANFMVAVGALTDKSVYGPGWESAHLQSTKNEKLTLGFPKLDIANYFDELERYFKNVSDPIQKPASLETALKYVTSGEKHAGWMNDAPFIRLPHGNAFRAVNVDKKIYQLTSVQERVHALKKIPFNFLQKKGIYLSAQYITTPITIGTASFFSITPPPVETFTKIENFVKQAGKKIARAVGKTQLYIPKTFVATHYFKKITSNNSFNEAIARNFIVGLARYKKQFLIEKFICNDHPAIHNLIITGQRPGDITISWTENNTGYSKSFNLKEELRILSGEKMFTAEEKKAWGDKESEYDFKYVITAITAAPTKTFSRELITDQFDNASKKVLLELLGKKKLLEKINTVKPGTPEALKVQKEVQEALEPIHPNVAISKTFIEKLIDRMKKKQNSQTKISDSDKILIYNLQNSLQKLGEALSMLAKTLK